MAPARFDHARVRTFLVLAGDRLDGEWLLIGGGAAAAWFAPDRTTEDLDIVGLGGTQDERFALMDLAIEAALPIEAVNSAADFFVRRIAGWRDRLVVLHRGQRATIYRPDATLFLLLKLTRLSETDLADCVALIAHCDASGEDIDRARICSALEQQPSSDDAALRVRRAQLLERLRPS
jgi:hypothetical protein